MIRAPVKRPAPCMLARPGEPRNEGRPAPTSRVCARSCRKQQMPAGVFVFFSTPTAQRSNPAPHRVRKRGTQEKRQAEEARHVEHREEKNAALGKWVQEKAAASRAGHEQMNGIPAVPFALGTAWGPFAWGPPRGGIRVTVSGRLDRLSGKLRRAPGRGTEPPPSAPPRGPLGSKDKNWLFACSNDCSPFAARLPLATPTPGHIAAWIWSSTGTGPLSLRPVPFLENDIECGVSVPVAGHQTCHPLR